MPGDSAKTTRHGLLAISAVVEPRIARQNGHSTAAFEGIGEGASRSADWADVLLTVPSDPCHRLPETACPKSPPKAANKSSKSVSTRSLGRRFFGLRVVTQDSPSVMLSKLRRDGFAGDLAVEPSRNRAFESRLRTQARHGYEHGRFTSVTDEDPRLGNRDATPISADENSGVQKLFESYNASARRFPRHPNLAIRSENH